MATAPSTSNEEDTAATAQKTEVWNGPEEIIQRSVGLLSGIKEGIDACMDKNAPSFIVRVQALNNVTQEAIVRGCRIRIVTEITKENLLDCKRSLCGLLEFVIWMG